MRYSMIGMWELTVTGPPALLNDTGPLSVVVRGFNDDAMDRSNLEFAAANEIARICGWGKSYDDTPEQYTPMAFGDPVLTANKYRTPDGSQQWFVGVYSASRSCGGPEEGGWWYDTGNLVQQTAVNSHDEARSLAEKLQGTEAEPGKFPYTGKRGSVLGGEDYDVRVGIEPFAEFYPEERPHYE